MSAAGTTFITTEIQEDPDASPFVRDQASWGRGDEEEQQDIKAAEEASRREHEEETSRRAYIKASERFIQQEGPPPVVPQPEPGALQQATRVPRTEQEKQVKEMGQMLLFWKVIVTGFTYLFDILAAVMFTLAVITETPVRAIGVVALVGVIINMMVWGSGIVFLPATYALYIALGKKACRVLIQSPDDEPCTSQHDEMAKATMETIRDQTHSLFWQVATGKPKTANSYSAFGDVEAPSTDSNQAARNDNPAHEESVVKAAQHAVQKLLRYLAGTRLWWVAGTVYVAGIGAFAVFLPWLRWLIWILPVWSAMLLVVQAVGLHTSYVQLHKGVKAEGVPHSCLWTIVNRGLDWQKGLAYHNPLKLLCIPFAWLSYGVAFFICPAIVYWSVHHHAGPLPNIWAWQHWALVFEEVPKVRITRTENPETGKQAQWNSWVWHVGRTIVSNASMGYFMIEVYHVLEWVRMGLFVTVAAIAVTRPPSTTVAARVVIAVLTAMVPMIKAARDKWKLLERGIQFWGYAAALVRQLQLTYMLCCEHRDGLLATRASEKACQSFGGHQDPAASTAMFDKHLNHDMRTPLCYSSLAPILKHLGTQAQHPVTALYRPVIRKAVEDVLKVADKALGAERFKTSFL